MNIYLFKGGSATHIEEGELFGNIHSACRTFGRLLEECVLKKEGEGKRRGV
jgi:hypothetical protein